MPVIRLKGGEGNGSDLVLPASLASDRRALLAMTPVEKSPYAAGRHHIHISLNGQQFAPVNTSLVDHTHSSAMVGSPYIQAHVDI